MAAAAAELVGTWGSGRQRRQPCGPGRCRAGSGGQPRPVRPGRGQHRRRAPGVAVVVGQQSAVPAQCQCGPGSARLPPPRPPTAPLGAPTPSAPFLSFLRSPFPAPRQLSPQRAGTAPHEHGLGASLGQPCPRAKWRPSGFDARTESEGGSGRLPEESGRNSWARLLVYFVVSAMTLRLRTLSALEVDNLTAQPTCFVKMVSPTPALD